MKWSQWSVEWRRCSHAKYILMRRRTVRLALSTRAYRGLVSRVKTRRHALFVPSICQVFFYPVAHTFMRRCACLFLRFGLFNYSQSSQQWYVKLALKLLWERQLGAASAVEGYVNVLPAQGTFETLVHWTDQVSYELLRRMATYRMRWYHQDESGNDTALQHL